MGVTIQPATRHYECDGCGKKGEGSTPANWANLHWGRNALDFQGNAVADASISLLLCSYCDKKAADAVNRAFAGYSSFKEPGDGV
jgi:hypothetical protein